MTRTLYAVCEVKQSLDYTVLDNAMRKLVVCHRLHRPKTNANRLVENRDFDSCFHGLTNPLYSAIVATSLREGIEIQGIIERFFDINKSLNRLEVVRCLCILGHGTVTWAFRDSSNKDIRPAYFMRDDLFEPIFPAYHKISSMPSALYPFVADLFLHLYNSVLAAEDIAIAYGPQSWSPMFPNSDDVILKPDSQWMEKLDWVKNEHGEVIPIKQKLEKNRRKKGFGSS